MPSVIAPGVKKGLIDGSSDEVVLDEPVQLHLPGSEHIHEGVPVVLKPEFAFGLLDDSRVGSLGPGRVIKGEGVRTVHNGILLRSNGPRFRSNVSGEVLIPILKTPMRLRFVNIVMVPVDSCLGSWAEPPIGLFFSQIFQRKLCHQHLLVGVENLFQMTINLWLREEYMP
jgi:hypothetical protein